MGNGSKERIKGSEADVVRLDVHDWYGNLIHRWRGQTNQKSIGVAIINTVTDLFALTNKDISDLSHQLNIEELTPEDRLREDVHRKVKWKHH